MADYEEKKDHVLNKLVTVIEELDENIATVEDLSEDPTKQHRLKKWYYEKKAIHDIKKILHDVNKYEKYDDKEMKKFEKEIEKFDD
ncbi:MAG: hypothetical protein ABS916_07965 [Carnobacterium sp.]|mgnify:CR=1 FL=1|uniref:hypothetical protein n=1 Tax=unclassified Carnobacterium TaxID=257487 RepID=UPI00020589C4|nr:hypothetical protein [Carnobacterium sp. 17-4]AEB28882.1 hypothetical protein CAR_c01310 [Carnobacterium sp. 17-4]